MKAPALIKVGPCGPHRVGLHIVLLIGEHFSKIKYNIYFFWISNKKSFINKEATTYNTQEERGKKGM